MGMTSGKILPSGTRDIHAHRLADMADVSSVTAPVSGQILVFRSGKWYAEDAAGAMAGIASTTGAGAVYQPDEPFDPPVGQIWLDSDETPAAMTGLVPGGGLTGQLLAKASDVDDDTQWSTLTIPEALPDQTGHDGEVLTTDGSAASWTPLPPTLVSYQAEAPATPEVGQVWVDSDSIAAAAPTPVSGGMVVDLGAYRYHVYQAAGTFPLTSTEAITVEVLAVGGGGGGGGDVNTGGAGGAGGLIEWGSAVLNGTHWVVVGAAGTGSTRWGHGGSGGNSTVTHSTGTLTAVGGGGGGSDAAGASGYSGGSGGGGCYSFSGAAGGRTVGQGNIGGTGASDGINYRCGGGGGGYSSAGQDGSPSGVANGGTGWTADDDVAALTGMSTFSSGGAAGAGTPGTGAGAGSASATMHGCAGGGSRDNGVAGGNGYWGIVIVRYLLSGVTRQGYIWSGTGWEKIGDGQGAIGFEPFFLMGA